MNNAPREEAFNSFYKQAKELYADGRIAEAKEMFLKAAEVANEISIKSTSLKVRLEYHELAVKILDFAKTKCTKRTPVNHGKSSGGDDSDETPAITAETSKSGVTFKDVAGLQDVKDQIIFNVIEPIRNPKLAAEYGIKPGGKILLYGPPGTGKTYIARAIAGEVNAVFYAVNCQDLISKYMGDSSKMLDKLFDDALKNESAIIFFDEFDSVASKRGDSTGGADAEMARFVATFLAKVDGFKKSKTNKMLLLIAATNRPWALDSAMLRGGRFDTQIYVGFPDQKAREFMVNKTLKDVPMESDVDLKKLAAALEGFGGGDIVAACEKIKLEAYRKTVLTGKKQKITRADCNNVLKNLHNNTTPEEMKKFKEYREGKRG